MDLHEDAVAEIKGPKCKKILNKLQAGYYAKDATWIKRLCLQLPQEPGSNWNMDDMIGYMLQEWKSHRYMQQCM